MDNPLEGKRILLLGGFPGGGYESFFKKSFKVDSLSHLSSEHLKKKSCGLESEINRADVVIELITAINEGLRQNIEKIAKQKYCICIPGPPTKSHIYDFLYNKNKEKLIALLNENKEGTNFFIFK